MNDNQNHRVMESGRTTSRVIAPPGGACSITIGVAPPAPAPTPAPPAPTAPAAEKDVAPPKKDGESPPVENLPNKPADATAAAAPAAAVTAPAAAAGEKQAPSEQKQKEEQQPVSANAFANGSNANGAQVMTGRPTSRVLQPPGGKCSISLG